MQKIDRTCNKTNNKAAISQCKTKLTPLDIDSDGHGLEIEHIFERKAFKIEDKQVILHFQLRQIPDNLLKSNLRNSIHL